MSYAEAKAWVKENLKPLGIKTKRDFIEYKRKGGYLPDNFPHSPYYTYFKTAPKDSIDWVSWPDFLSNSNDAE